MGTSSNKCDKSLIRKIKSSYNLEQVFSFLDQELKLDIIINNKYLQKMLGINIEDYKKVCWKYKVGDKNGKGKEYLADTNQLLYEGEFLKWKRNGIGKEYSIDSNRLIYKGEFLNGERNGKGKEFNNNGYLIFEGKFLNGKRLDGEEKNIMMMAIWYLKEYI